MSRTKNFKDKLKQKTKKKAWKTGKELGKSYLKYKAFTVASRKASSMIFGRKKQEKTDG